MPNDNDRGVDNDLLFRAAADYLEERIEWLKRERADVEATRARCASALEYIDERLAWLLDERRALAQFQIDARRAQS